MLWNQQWGPQLDKLSALARGGAPVPALDNRPHLLPGLDFYMTAFLELLHDRPVGMGVGTIPWSSIDRWAVRHDLDNDDLSYLITVIRKMEEALQKQLDKPKDKGRQP